MSDAGLLCPSGSSGRARLAHSFANSPLNTHIYVELIRNDGGIWGEVENEVHVCALIFKRYACLSFS